MVQCPKCNGQFEADFGMTPCPDCGNMVIVDVDGQAESAANIEISAEVETDTEAEIVEEPMTQSFTKVQPLVEDVEQVASDTIPEIESFSENVYETPLNEEVSLNQEVSGTEVDNEWAYQSLEDKEKQIHREDLSDIADFGNSEVSMAKEGLYLYEIKISGIDSAQIKKQLVESLVDKRFAWNISAIVEKIVAGELVLEKVSAVKASILINRIKNLPVQIQWRQNVLTKMDV